MSRLTLDELIEMEMAVQAAHHDSYASASPEIKALGWLACPAQDSAATVRTRIEMALARQRNFRPAGWMHSAGYGR